MHTRAFVLKVFLETTVGFMTMSAARHRVETVDSVSKGSIRSYVDVHRVSAAPSVPKRYSHAPQTSTTVTVPTHYASAPATVASTFANALPATSQKMKAEPALISTSAVRHHAATRAYARRMSNFTRANVHPDSWV